MNVDFDTLLALSLESNDSGEDTVRGYLGAQLSTLWLEGEDFSGKRPLGNSGWKCDLVPALVAGGFMTATLDEYGDIDFDDDELDALIQGAISHMCGNKVRTF